MTTSEGQDLGTLEATEFRVPRLLRAAEILCSNGRVLRGRVFLPATAESHAGAMRAEEWMNDSWQDLRDNGVHEVALHDHARGRRVYRMGLGAE